MHKEAKVKRRVKVFASDPEYKLSTKILRYAWRISAGKVKTDSPKFVFLTSFSSQHDFRNHMSSFFNNENGFTWENYGEKWDNEHRIPKIATTFSTRKTSSAAGPMPTSAPYPELKTWRRMTS